MVIENAWNEHRGWAKRARAMQAASRRWSTVALCAAAAAAALGCAAGQAGGAGAAGRALAFLAAVAAGVTPVLGRDILDARREAGWIRARATAEAIKSECFRYAARLGPYAGADAASAFAARRAALSEAAAREGLTMSPDPDAADPRRPPAPMDAAWYLANRLRQQRDGFYVPGQLRHERAAGALRAAALCLALAGTVIGAAAAALNLTALAPWIGVLSSIGALLVAYGLLDRRQHLAAAYAAVAASLSRIEEGAGDDLQALVDATEGLLEAEHLGWTDRMSKSIPPPPAAPQPQPPPRS